jgi:hypothetical protein
MTRRDGVHGLVRGRCCRLLLEHDALDGTELQRLARLALSPVTPARDAAAWIEGLLRGSALLLMQYDGLWLALDAWLSELDGAAFVAMLPLLRRACSGFQPPERRAMGEKVKHLHTPGGHGEGRPAGAGWSAGAIDHDRARLILPVLGQILGGDGHADR